MDKFEERYKKLNKEQRDAVDHLDGPLLVVAGPGTGKTEILSLRVANILRKKDTLPKNILCVTFTNSASHNMRQRLADLIAADAYKVSIQTFHSLGVDIMNSHPDYFYNSTTFYPVDDISQIQILEKLIQELDFDNPLKSYHPSGGYAYLGDIKNMISYLKREGISVDEFRKILAENKKQLNQLNPDINRLFSPSITKKTLANVEDYLQQYEKNGGEENSGQRIKPIKEVLIGSMQEALSEALKDNRTKPLTEWKSNYTDKDESGKTVIKDTKYIEKLVTLADLYEKYQHAMYESKYYDYDDMIFDAIKGIRDNRALKYELQDKYEYILVDEFQDTNGAQLMLLDLITNSRNKRPNIMAVGDDDQAVYKFQGAELSNIIGFDTKYIDNRIIPITRNYRSTKEILDVAVHVIAGCESRLESRIDGLIKKISSHIPEGKALSRVENMSFTTESGQYIWVANRIRELIESGKHPGEIAVISRNHKYLEKISQVLNSVNIPISYEKNNNVLNEPHIRQLVRICMFVNSVCKKNMDEADEFLPEILAYPFWGVERKKIWELSGVARKNPNLTWLEVMRKHGDEKIKSIAGFLVNTAVMSEYESVEHILDEIMGAKEMLLPDTEEDAEEAAPAEDEKFVSPFKEYYFGRHRLRENSVEYIMFLSGLRTFIQSIRDYKKEKFLMLDDLLEFIELSEKNGIPYVDNSPFVNAFDAVNLLTAHKAKGLEFDSVFVINCQEDVWKPKKRGSSLPEPVNLPVSPAGDNEDDQRRLFYVAVTRAKHNLFLCSYDFTDENKKSELLSFLIQDKNEGLLADLLELKHVNDTDTDNSLIVLSSSWESRHKPPVIHDEKAVIDKLLENYRLSVTHLNNFLNVANGGPYSFFEQNLLRFPQSKSVAGAFGSAIHRTIERIYRNLKDQDKIPEKDEVLKWFEEELVPERLNEMDFKDCLSKGKKALRVFYDKRIDTFDSSHYSELSFKNEGVFIGKAHLTGKIDKIVKNGEKELSVHDFKTGKAKKDWEKGNSQYDKVLLHGYRRQLVYYKILVENSAKFGDRFKVNSGYLEFVEPDNDEIHLLPLSIEQEEVDRTVELITKVYEKIMNMDFPDVSGYKKSVKGIVEFENDLIEGNV